ncbi:MAG TPA: DUF302 domain-containing protein [Methylophilaceae bacterium]|nr:DUF302 domain-containing protein [Methylophilaceae bacterium]HQR60251.1 DUF302 domain-containing protein [Methylophilaceae bacterium]
MKKLLILAGALWLGLLPASADSLPPVNPDKALYIVKVEPGVSYDDVVTSLKSAAEGKNFVSPATFPIGEHIRQRGLPLQGVLEVHTYCSLGIGAEILLEYPEFAAFAPCRIAIYEKQGNLYLALDRPTYALRHVDNVNQRARDAAQQMEDTLIWMLDKARKGEI